MLWACALEDDYSAGWRMGKVGNPSPHPLAPSPHPVGRGEGEVAASAEEVGVTHVPKQVSPMSPNKCHPCP